jgi:putative tricarboxylic transport membrane protein
MLAVFVLGWFVSAGFTPEARLVPRLLCTGGVIVALVLVALELKARRTDRTGGEDPHDEGTPRSGTAEHEAIETGQPAGAPSAQGAVAVAEPRTETRREFVLVAFRMFAWMIAFLVLVTIGGYLAALLMFIPAFLLFVARARPRTAVIYTLVVALFILALPALIHIGSARGTPGRPRLTRLPVHPQILTRNGATAPGRGPSHALLPHSLEGPS